MCQGGMRGWTLTQVTGEFEAWPYFKVIAAVRSCLEAVVAAGTLLKETAWLGVQTGRPPRGCRTREASAWRS